MSVFSPESFDPSLSFTTSSSLMISSELADQPFQPNIRSVRKMDTKVCLWPCFGCSLLPETLLLSLGACFICPFVDIDFRLNTCGCPGLVLTIFNLCYKLATSAWILGCKLYSTTDSNTVWTKDSPYCPSTPSKMWKFLLVANDLAVTIKNVEISTSSSSLVCYF